MPSLRLIIGLLVGAVVLSTGAGGLLGWSLASSTAASSSIGPAGPTGAQGADGEDGAAGPMGPQGIAGTRGEDGAIGPRGATGATGATGPTGAAGAQGATGSQGAAGTNGAPGTQGIQGPQGLQGIQGVQGASAPAVSTTSASGVLAYTGVVGEYGGELLPGTFGPGTYVVGYSFRIHTFFQTETIRCQLVDGAGTQYVQSAAQTIDQTPWYSFRESGVIVLSSSTTLRLTCNETTGAFVDTGFYEDQALFAITMP